MIPSEVKKKIKLNCSPYNVCQSRVPNLYYRTVRTLRKVMNWIWCALPTLCSTTTLTRLRFTQCFDTFWVDRQSWQPHTTRTTCWENMVLMFKRFALSNKWNLNYMTGILLARQSHRRMVRIRHPVCERFLHRYSVSIPKALYWCFFLKKSIAIKEAQCIWDLFIPMCI